MNEKLKIDTRVRRLPFYLDEIENGLLQIPPFQRDKVWGNKERIELFDSLKNGYPIGSILLWKPQEKNLFEGREKFGAYSIVPNKVQDFFYVLDGFQRLSTLFACLINPAKTTLNRDEDELKRNFTMYYDLDKEEFFIPRAIPVEIYQVPLYQLLDTRASFQFEKALDRGGYDEAKVAIYVERYAHLGATFIDYSLPAIEIKGGTIEEAVEIFSRVNSKGATISPDWMVSALSYNREKNFRLGSIIDTLLEDLSSYNFHEIKRDVLFQCILNAFGSPFFDQSKKIESLAKRPDFIEVTQRTVISIKKAVQFLFEELLVVSSKLLPYNIQLVFVSDFFNKIPAPTPTQLAKLKEWFWITSYANYFTLYSLSKQREAYKQFQRFLMGEEPNPVYSDRPDIPFSVADIPNRITFGSVRAKCFVLFLLNYANDFQKVTADDIDGLKLFYLFDGNQNPENLVPMLTYTNSDKNDFQVLTKTPKPRDLSTLFTCEVALVAKYFINEEMQLIFQSNAKNKHDRILKKRQALIKAAEQSFVQKWDIYYSNMVTIMLSGISKNF